MKIAIKNGVMDVNEIRDVIIEHYASKPPCHWGVIIRFSSDFNYSPLNAIKFYHDKTTDINQMKRLLRRHGISILHVLTHNENEHTITIMNHTTEN